MKKSIQITFILIAINITYSYCQKIFEFDNRDIYLELRFDSIIESDNILNLRCYILSKKNILYISPASTSYNRGKNFQSFYNNSDKFFIELGHTTSFFIHGDREALKTTILLKENDTIHYDYNVKIKEVEDKKYINLNFDYMNPSNLSDIERKDVRLILHKEFYPNDSLEMFKCSSYIKYCEEFEIVFPFNIKLLEAFN